MADLVGDQGHHDQHPPVGPAGRRVAEPTGACWRSTDEGRAAISDLMDDPNDPSSGCGRRPRCCSGTATRRGRMLVEIRDQPIELRPALDHRQAHAARVRRRHPRATRGSRHLSPAQPLGDRVELGEVVARSAPSASPRRWRAPGRPEVAPEMTHATAGWAARPAIATSRIERSRASAYFSSGLDPVPVGVLEPGRGAGPRARARTAPPGRGGTCR